MKLVKKEERGNSIVSWINVYCVFVMGASTMVCCFIKCLQRSKSNTWCYPKRQFGQTSSRDSGKGFEKVTNDRFVYLLFCFVIAREQSPKVFLTVCNRPSAWRFHVMKGIIRTISVGIFYGSFPIFPWRCPKYKISVMWSFKHSQ